MAAIISKTGSPIGAILLAGSGVLLLAGLGHQPLRDDEATTALYGESM